MELNNATELLTKDKNNYIDDPNRFYASQNACIIYVFMAPIDKIVSNGYINFKHGFGSLNILNKLNAYIFDKVTKKPGYDSFLTNLRYDIDMFFKNALEIGAINQTEYEYTKEQFDKKFTRNAKTYLNSVRKTFISFMYARPELLNEKLVNTNCKKLNFSKYYIKNSNYCKVLEQIENYTLKHSKHIKVRQDANIRANFIDKDSHFVHKNNVEDSMIKK